MQRGLAGKFRPPFSREIAPSLVHLLVIWPKTLIEFMDYLLIHFAERIFRRSCCLRARVDTCNKVDELQHKFWVSSRCGVGEVYCGRLCLRDFPPFPVDGYGDLIARFL